MSREEANAKALVVFPYTYHLRHPEHTPGGVQWPPTDSAQEATMLADISIQERAREAHVAYAARLQAAIEQDLARHIDSTPEERITFEQPPLNPLEQYLNAVANWHGRTSAQHAEAFKEVPGDAKREHEKLKKRLIDDIPNGVVTYRDLMLLLELGVLEGSDPEHVNGTSIDITLGSILLGEEDNTRRGNLLSLRDRTPLPTKQFELTERVVYPAKGVILKPGEFALAQSQQVFNLPDCISAEYKLKSSMARIGLNHLNAGWCDPGWNGSVLTLELKNDLQHHSVLLQLGDRIGQVIFYKHPPVPADRSYRVRGRYNGDKTVHGVKP